jgi:hypothetical protein
MVGEVEEVQRVDETAVGVEVPLAVEAEVPQEVVGLELRPLAVVLAFRQTMCCFKGMVVHDPVHVSLLQSTLHPV